MACDRQPAGILSRPLAFGPWPWSLGTLSSRLSALRALHGSRTPARGKRPQVRYTGHVTTAISWTGGAFRARFRTCAHLRAQTGYPKRAKLLCVRKARSVTLAFFFQRLAEAGLGWPRSSQRHLPSFSAAVVHRNQPLLEYPAASGSPSGDTSSPVRALAPREQA